MAMKPIRTILDPQVALDAFKQSMKKPEQTVAAQLDQRRTQQIAKNRNLIKSVAKTVYLCGEQGISLRGHRDDSSAQPSANHGNFLELLRFRSDGGDVSLADHLSKHRLNATFTSKTIQNELITILGDHIRTSILDEVNQARFYSILSDEVSDVAGLEQVSVVLRFVDKTGSIREEFA
eukprot:scpid102965/ scgid11535/ 52 kDa repressor of the inhibitor of the protein kinase; 58 kDa interferon-induced protein kinase-interacting protein; Death-associated protein 4; THAP domain-containing protein 0